MSPATIFQIANSFVLIGWLLLFVAPKWEHTNRIVLNVVIGILSLTYTVVIFFTISDFSPDSFSTLANVKALFQEDMAVTAGWIHYLAFDLFVGAYIVKEGVATGMARWKYTICLPFTFMLGPFGLLLNLIIKRVLP